MGNQLIKNYDIEKEPYATGGNSSVWNVYRGNKQDKSRTQVSVFIFDKKIVEKNYKQYKEEILSFIRKEYQCLARYKHPQILNVIEPLMEDQKSMAFITEYVEGSLSTLISRGQHDALGNSELELKIHFDEMLRILYFLHNNGKLACLGVSPENIWVTKTGKWKLGSFLFATQIIQSTAETNNIDLGTKMFENFLKLYPNLNFTATEVVNIPSQCSFYSDVFSLGMLFLTICKCQHEKSCNDPYLINATNKYTYEQNVSKLWERVTQMPFFVNQPQNLKNILARMVDKNQFSRASVGEIQNCDWLNDPFVKAIKHLETISDIEQSQQVNFLKGLQQILFRYNDVLLKRRIIPSLMLLFKYAHLIPQVMAMTIDVMKKENYLTKSEFSEICWPFVKFIAASKEMSAQTLYLYVENLELFASFTARQDFLLFILPLALKCYEFSVPKLQELAISKTEYLIKYLDYNMTKSQLIPRVLSVCVDNNVGIRKKGLTCLKKIYANIDKATINEQVLGTLQKVRKIGNDSELSMILLQIYQGIAKDLGIDSIGNLLLPQLIPFLIDANLTKVEYVEYSKTIQQLLKRIDDERLATLPNQGTASVNNTFNFENQIKEQEKNQTPTSACHQQTQASHGGNEFDFLNQFENQQSAPQQQSNPVQANKMDSEFAAFNFDDKKKDASMPQTQQVVSAPSNDFDFNFDGFDQAKPSSGNAVSNDGSSKTGFASQTQNDVTRPGKLPIFPTKEASQLPVAANQKLDAFKDFHFSSKASNPVPAEKKVDPFFEKFQKQQQQKQSLNAQPQQQPNNTINSSNSSNELFSFNFNDSPNTKKSASNQVNLNQSLPQNSLTQQQPSSKIQLKNLGEVNFFEQKPASINTKNSENAPNAANKGYLLNMDYDPFSEIESAPQQNKNNTVFPQSSLGGPESQNKSDAPQNHKTAYANNPFLDNQYDPFNQPELLQQPPSTSQKESSIMATKPKQPNVNNYDFDLI